ncbi:hypothetical protein HK096_000340, partial [Nowakowskiella sp. JEL0078]
QKKENLLKKRDEKIKELMAEFDAGLKLLEESYSTIMRNFDEEFGECQLCYDN